MSEEEKLRAFLQYFYNHSNTPVPLGLNSIEGVSPSEYGRLFNHLETKGLLTGTAHPNSGVELPTVVAAQITSSGVQAIDKGLQLAPPPAPASQTINISHSHNVAAGNNNTIQQTFDQSVQVLIDQIEQSNGSPEEKAEAKSRLRHFLEHPLVVGLASAALGAVL